jgi:hypothetical protein
MTHKRKLSTVLSETSQKSDSTLIQKSNPLQTLSETTMTLSEFKILDAYLSRIDSHKPDERYVCFEKGELEKLLGVDKINKPDLDKRLDNLFRSVTIRDERKPKKSIKIALFTIAEYEPDENGQWQVNLACSPEAMEYVFNIENIGYFKYRLKNVIDLTSRYSYILYLYLENNRYRQSWEIQLDELKTLLRCTAERYGQYKFFNSEVLKKCHKELNEKTSIKYSYKPIKSGRKVTHIEFDVDTLPSIDEPISKEVPGQLDIFGKSDTLELWGRACDDKFSRVEMAQLAEVLRLIPSDKFSPYAVNDDIELQRYHYLAEKYAAMKRVNEKTAVKNRFAYMLAILKADAGIKP